MATKAELKRAARELELQEPGSSGEVISQRKLQQFESMELELRALKQKFEKYRSEMSDVLRSGASVSTGRRGVRSGIYFRRHPSYKQALIAAKGEEYQKKVLEGTEYKPYFYVKFITTGNGSGRGEE